ncbi:gp35 [Streptococcus pneumoniae]|nr:gp35 [Streptococcus pneumoniae]VRT51842.1 gp35 [Streptococcus pneumoniae]VTZ40595.1 gp35 [Streptococcus pneumoniae]
MVEDIVPSLLKKIKSEFEGARLDSEVLKDLLSKLQHSKASYLDANKYAIEIGEILSKALGASLTNETLPDGKMYYNIAQRVLTDVLGRNYELVSDYTEQVQKNLNSQAKIGLAAQVPELNQDRIDGLVNRLASEESFDDVKWLLVDPIVIFSQSIVDDSIRKNAEFHHKVGLSPKIFRRVVGHPCKWCKSLEGSYTYPEVPKDIYRRHGNCRCTVDYHPGNGKKQNVHTKKWTDEKQKLVRKRSRIGIESVDEREQKRYNRVMKSSGAVYGAWNDRNDPYNKERDRHAQEFYESVRNRNKQHEIVKVSKNSRLSQSDVEKIYNHIFINEYDLEDGRKRFDPSYDMAESWRRLSEIGGKNIQPHDLVMLRHELMEHDLMAKGMKYDEAHELTNKSYNYQKAWIAWMKQKGDL